MYRLVVVLVHFSFNSRFEVSFWLRRVDKCSRQPGNVVSGVLCREFVKVFPVANTLLAVWRFLPGMAGWGKRRRTRGCVLGRWRRGLWCCAIWAG